MNSPLTFGFRRESVFIYFLFHIFLFKFNPFFFIHSILFIFSLFLDRFGFYLFRTRMFFSVQFDASSEREIKIAKCHDRETKGKLCLNVKNEWEKKTRNGEIVHKRESLTPFNPIYIQWNTGTNVQTSLIPFLRAAALFSRIKRKVKKPECMYGKKRLIETPHSRTCNLDACATLICMRKWSVQRTWNIKVNDTKQTLKTWTRICIYKSCLTFNPSDSFLGFSCSLSLCMRCLHLIRALMCIWSFLGVYTFSKGDGFHWCCGAQPQARQIFTLYIFSHRNYLVEIVNNWNWRRFLNGIWNWSSDDDNVDDDETFDWYGLQTKLEYNSNYWLSEIIFTWHVQLIIGLDDQLFASIVKYHEKKKFHIQSVYEFTLEICNMKVHRLQTANLNHCTYWALCWGYNVWTVTTRLSLAINCGLFSSSVESVWTNPFDVSAVV